MFVRIPLLAVLTAGLLAGTAAAQGPSMHAHHMGHAGAPAAAPYAGQQTRAIKALSPEDIAALEEGSGMGLAKAAELNHYPGPRHVLDLAAELALDEQQRAAAQAAFDAMRARALRLGADILRGERELDAAFAGGTIDPEILARLTAHIATLQGELRETHLRAHLEVHRLLTAQQVATYDRLRGYAAP